MANVKPYFIVNGIKFYPYRVVRDKVVIKNNIFGWRSALKIARNCANDLFNNYHKIEIINLYTGEVLTLEEAELKAKLFKARKLKGAANSGTT